MNNWGQTPIYAIVVVEIVYYENWSLTPIIRA